MSSVDIGLCEANHVSVLWVLHSYPLGESELRKYCFFNLYLDLKKKKTTHFYYSCLPVKVKESSFVSTNFYYTWIFLSLWLWTDGFFAVLWVKGIWLYLSSWLSSEATSLLCLAHTCGLPLGLINSERLWVTQSALTACSQSQISLSSPEGKNLCCPPAKRK